MILFAAQDAGPAKYISYIVKSLNKNSYKCMASKVSVNVFLEMNVQAENIIHSLQTNNFNLIVTGTCLDDGIDKEAVRYGKTKGIQTISIIEHWSLYKKRFELNGIPDYPDKIFVNDNLAREEAESDGIPSEKIRVVGNPVLENVKFKYFTKSIYQNWRASFVHLKRSKIITFISESLRCDFPEHSREFQGFDEFIVIKDILQFLDKNSSLIIKLHPSENLNKYDFLNKFENVSIIQETDLNKLIQFSNLIIGMGSMLLLEASLIKDTVYSYRPNERVQFVGNKTGMVKKIKDKIELKKVLTNFETEINSIKYNYFQGSTNYISNLLKYNS